MKELTIEQKARRYDEAIKRVENIRTGKCETTFMFTEGLFEHIFPELAESEDDRIRKDIISMCQTLGKEEWVAWLEKQGEQKSIWHNEDEEPQKDSLILLIMQSGTPVVAKIIEPNHTFNHGERWAYIDDLLERQCKQKPVKFSQEELDMLEKEIVRLSSLNLDVNKDSKEISLWIDYFLSLSHKQKSVEMIQWKGDNLKEVIDFTGKDKNFDKWFKSFAEYERYVHEHNNIFKLFNEDGSHYEVPVGAWIVKTPDGYNVASKAILKQKPAWSEEDEESLLELSQCCDLNKTQVQWLLSLKDRVLPQPKQEWSNWDKTIIESIEALCDEKIKSVVYQDIKEHANDIKEWLKSLRPHKQWKPSEGQLECLGYAIDKAEKDWSPLTNNRIYLTLKALKEQLLELRRSKV